MIIINSNPPKEIYDQCLKLFKIGKGTVWTVGEVIYNPDSIRITEDLFIHESTHGEQQKHNETVAKIWWMRYLEDKDFRLSQEIEAYGNQYKFICRIVKDKNSRYKNLHQLAKFLSSGMYGNLISQSEAEKAIKNSSLTKQKVV